MFSRCNTLRPAFPPPGSSPPPPHSLKTALQSVAIACNRLIALTCSFAACLALCVQYERWRAQQRLLAAIAGNQEFALEMRPFVGIPARCHQIDDRVCHCVFYDHLSFHHNFQRYRFICYGVVLRSFLAPHIFRVLCVLSLHAFRPWVLPIPPC